MKKDKVKFNFTAFGQAIKAARALIAKKMKLIPTTNFVAYTRKMLIDGYIIQVDHTDIKAMTAETQKIGVNVNQIARRVSTNK